MISGSHEPLHDKGFDESFVLYMGVNAMEEFWNKFFEKSFESKVSYACSMLEESMVASKSEYIRDFYLRGFEKAMNSVIETL